MLYEVITVSDCVDGNMGSAVRQVAHGGGDVADGAGIDALARSQPAGQGQLFGFDIDRDDAGAERRGYHDGRQAHAAAAEDDDPLAG